VVCKPERPSSPLAAWRVARIRTTNIRRYDFRKVKLMPPRPVQARGVVLPLLSRPLVPVSLSRCRDTLSSDYSQDPRHKKEPTMSAHIVAVNIDPLSQARVELIKRR
jgi:hypothetical protein